LIRCGDDFPETLEKGKAIVLTAIATLRFLKIVSHPHG
jgi:hypothetical protein